MSVSASARLVTLMTQPLSRGGVSLWSSTRFNPRGTQLFNMTNFTPSIPVSTTNSYSSALGWNGGSFLRSISLEGIINQAILYIKRTWQPSLVKRKRKHGFLKRQKSVGGRKILKRRMRKNRHRLAC